MKKSCILNRLFVATLLILLIFACAVTVVACNKNNNNGGGTGGATVSGFIVYVGGNAYSVENNTIEITYGDVFDLDSVLAVKVKYGDGSEITAEKGEGGYTVTGLPDTLNANADGYNLSVKYGSYDAVTVKLIVNKKQFVKPTVSGDYEYSGVAQTANFSNFDSAAMNVSGNVKTDAGTSNVTVTLKDTLNCSWSDGTANEVTLPWTIAKVTLAKPTLSGTYTYTGAAQTAVLINFDADTMNVSGNVRTDAGTYDVTVTLKDANNYDWSDEGDCVFEWTISKAQIEKPVYTESNFVYDGTAKTVNYSANAKYTILGGVQTDAGTYSVSASINDKANYEWTDGTTTDTTQNWTIAKVQLVKPTLSGSYSYTGSEQTAVLNGFNSTTMTVSGNTKTASGTTAVTVGLSDAANYEWTSGGSLSFTIDWYIAGIASTVSTVPTTVSTEYFVGITLDDIALSGGVGSVDGTFAWTDGTTELNAGTANYSATFAPTDGNYENCTCLVSVTVSQIDLSLPTVSGVYTYNGTEQTAVLDGFDSETMIKRGDTHTDAGETYITFTVKDSANYTFGGYASRYISWIIGRKSVTVTADDKSVTYGDAAPEYTVTYDGLERIF